MNTALRKSRSGMSQTIVLKGEASPELLDELRVDWASVESRFETEVFLTDASPTGPTLGDALLQIRSAAEVADHARPGSWAATYGLIDRDGRAGWGAGPIERSSSKQ